MARFVRLKAYLDGWSREPEDWVVNVNQIVSLYPGTWNPDGTEEVPCTYVDTTRITGMRVDSTLDAVLGAIERVPEVGFSPREIEVIEDLAKQQDLTVAQALRQAVRIYQAIKMGNAEFTWKNEISVVCPAPE